MIFDQENKALGEGIQNRGDHLAKVEIIGEDSKKYSIRVVDRPAVLFVKPLSEVREQTEAHKIYRDEMLATNSNRGISHPDYKRDLYDYNKLLPEVGTPESIPMGKPQLVLVPVRHLIHTKNVVPDEAKEEYKKGRGQDLIDDLEITDKSMVVVLNSSVTQFEASESEVVKNSRTESTMEVVKEILSDRKVDFVDFNDRDKMPDDMVMVLGNYSRAIDEFSLVDSLVNEQALAHAAANRKAKKDDEALPYPDDPSVPPVVYASEAPNVQDLEKKTGMNEVASATVARVFRGIDQLENYFIKSGNIPDGVDKVIIIAGQHGQYMTDISEALMEVTRGTYPIIFSENGAYQKINIGTNDKGEIVEEFVTVTGPRTGMKLV